MENPARARMLECQMPADQEQPIIVKEPKLYLELLKKKPLQKIFDYLDLYDLLQMCDEGEHFKQIIAEDIMPKRVLDISKISKNYSVRHAFKKLGQFVPEVVIKQSDIQWKDEKFSELEEIVRLIGKRCAAGNLKKVTVTFDMSEANCYSFRTEIPDCLKTLESLTIESLVHLMYSVGVTANFDNFLETLLTGCTQLQSLTLHQINLPGKYLRALSKTKLCMLKIKICYIKELKYWTEFIQKGIPTLKSFSFINNILVAGTGFYERFSFHIMEAFPAIEHLSFDSSCVPLGSFLTMEASPARLKSLHLECPNLDTNILQTLMKMVSLQELSICVRNPSAFGAESKAIWLNSMKHFKSLRSFEIVFESHGLEWDDVIQWLRELPCITDTCLIGNRAFLQKHIEDVVSISPKMLCLKLGMPISSFTINLYDKLVRDRSRWYHNSPQLNIYMDAKKVVKLKQSITDYATKQRCIRIKPFKRELD